MNEWKELQIDNLPSNLLTGKYEFGYYNLYNQTYEISKYEPIEVLWDVVKNKHQYYYREPNIPPETP